MFRIKIYQVINCIFQDDLLEKWSTEVAREIWEQKPAFGIIHVQGLKAAQDPDRFADLLLRRFDIEL
jgi:hypothetical protein